MNLRFLSWTIVYVLNLIIPVLFAVSVVSGWGWLGVVLAVFTYWILGVYVCKASKSITQALLVGGFFVGFSQFSPLLHYCAGSIALNLEARSWLHTPTDSPIDMRYHIGGSSGAFLATAITGGILIGVALFLGFLFYGLYVFARLIPDPVNAKKVVIDPDGF